MSGPKVDVLQILSACAHGAAFGAHYATARDIDAAREAVAELIEALGGMLDAFNHPSADRDPAETKAVRVALAALANIGGVK